MCSCPLLLSCAPDFTKCCKRGWVIPPPTHPPPTRRFRQKLDKYNKSLKDPVRGAGSAQVQIRSYRNRQSGNLASKVRNAFPVLTALSTSFSLPKPSQRFTPRDKVQSTIRYIIAESQHIQGQEMNRELKRMTQIPLDKGHQLAAKNICHFTATFSK